MRPHPTRAGAQTMPRAVWARLLDQNPAAVADFQHPESVEVQAKVIARRHVDHTSGPHEVLRLLDRVPNRLRIRAAGALDRVDKDEKAVIGVTTESRDRLIPALLELPLVIYDNRLLRVIVRQFLGNQKRGRRQAHTIAASPASSMNFFEATPWL